MLFRDKQQVLICLLAGVMVAGFLLVRYRPLCQQMKFIRQSKKAHTIAVAKAVAQSSQLPVFREQVLRTRSSVGDYKAKVPGNRDLGAFLQQITNLMKQHDLTDQLIQPAEQIETERFNCIPVNMRGTGSLRQIFEFFASLQALDRLVRIESIELLNSSDFSGEVTMHADTVIYYQPDSGLR